MSVNSPSEGNQQDLPVLAFEEGNEDRSLQYSPSLDSCQICPHVDGPSPHNQCVPGNGVLTVRDNKNVHVSSSQGSVEFHDLSATSADYQRIERTADFGLEISSDSETDLDLWHRAWSALADGGDLSRAIRMLTTLLRLPPASSFTPSPLTVWRVIHRLSDYASKSQTDDVYAFFELVADTIEKRLSLKNTTEKSSSRMVTEVLVSVKQVRNSLQEALMNVIRQNPDDTRATALLSRIASLFKEEISKMESVLERSLAQEDSVKTIGGGADGNAETPWTGWCKPTVGWLQNGHWLSAPNLLKQYEHMMSYIDLCERLVKIHPFHWGAGALFPKCHYKLTGSEQACNLPLCVKIPHARGMCSFEHKTDKCIRPPRWRCPRKGHNAVCETCLRVYQAYLIGEPSPLASTQIYDGIIEREELRHNSASYIVGNLKCRGSRTREASWISLRQRCNALIGVVRLGALCEPLPADKYVEWAVTVDTGGMAEHFKEVLGDECRLAFRFLSQTDLPSLRPSTHSISQGTNVAIIDLGASLPEIIPVLTSLADKNFIPNLEDIPLFISLTSSSNSEKYPSSYHKTEPCVSEMLEKSEIDVIQQLSPHGRKYLFARILKMIETCNFDVIQRKTFLSAFSSGLHWTQTPSVTEDNSLCISLIIAFDLIRSAAELDGATLGPVVFLTHGTRELDRLLADLYKTHQVEGKITRYGTTVDDTSMGSKRRSMLGERDTGKSSNRPVTTDDVDQIVLAFQDFSEEFETRATKTNQGGSPCAPVNSCNVNDIVKFILLALRLYAALRLRTDDLRLRTVRSILEKFINDGVVESFEDDSALLSSIFHLSNGTDKWIDDRGGRFRSAFLITQWIIGNNPPSIWSTASEDERPNPARDINVDSYRKIINRPSRDDSMSQHPDKSSSFDEHHRVDNGVICGASRVGNFNLNRNCSSPNSLDVEAFRVVRNTQAPFGILSCEVAGCGRKVIDAKFSVCANRACSACIKERSTGTSDDPIHSITKDSLFCFEHKCLMQGCPERRAIQYEKQDYCIIHGCRACAGNRKVVDTAPPTSRLCSEHRCKFVFSTTGYQCRSQRAKKSLFCESHTCFVCKRKLFPLVRKVSEPHPRNVCVLHPLCTFRISADAQCGEELKQFDRVFCSRHESRSQTASRRRMTMQCNALNNRKKRCKVYGFTRNPPFYCDVHQDQRPLQQGFGSSSRNFERTSLHDHTNDVVMFGQRSENYSRMENEQVCRSKLSINRNVCLTNVKPLGVPTIPYGDGENMGESISSFFISEDDVTLNRGAGSIKLLNGQKVGFGLNDGNQFDFSAKSDIQAGNISVEMLSDRANSTGSLINSEFKATQEISIDKQKDNDFVANDYFEKDSCGKGRASHPFYVDGVDLAPPSAVVSDSPSESDTGGMNREAAFSADVSDIDGNQKGIQRAGIDVNNDGGGYSLLPDHPNKNKGYPNQWIWGEKLAARFCRLGIFFKIIAEDMAEVWPPPDNYNDDTSRKLADDSTVSLVDCNIIGATVDEVSRRLHSLRSAEPFAMVIDSGSQDLESFWPSIFSMRSLRKVELIGDSQQMPAFISH